MTLRSRRKIVVGIVLLLVAGGAFLALLWPRLQDRDGRRLALAAAAVALLAVPLVPSGLPVLVAGGVALVVGVLHARREAP